jgi:hypothetical protein
MEHNIEDLMSSAVAQRPMDFENAFKTIMIDRITDAIDERKIELAKTIFNNSKDSIDTKETD